ncbi:MAG: hypothetical protein OXB88_02900 [Bacteriovoracales bacterium]|nr:hypothetical protein [Bacteriovoracales bacterium]
MKFLSLATICTMILSVHPVRAALSSTGFLSSLKESPLDLTYGAMGITSRDRSNSKIDGMYLYHDFYLSYKLTDRDTLRMMPEIITPYGDSARMDGNSTGYSGTEFYYKRSALMNQDAHGVDLMFQQRYFMNKDDTKTRGTASTRFYINRKMSNSFSLDGIVRYDMFNNSSDWTPGDDKTKNRKERRLRLYVSPTWTLSDKLSTALSFVYSNAQNEDKTQGEDLQLVPQVSYKLGDQSLGMAAYVPATKGGDGKSGLVEDIADQITYELSYTLSVF